MTMFLTYVPGFKYDLIHTYDKITGIIQPLSLLNTLFVAFLSGVTYGVSVGIAFKVGACTMGLDPVLRFYSRQKGRNLGPFLFGVSFINAALWIFVRYFVQSNFEAFGIKSN